MRRHRSCVQPTVVSHPQISVPTGASCLNSGSYGVRKRRPCSSKIPSTFTHFFKIQIGVCYYKSNTKTKSPHTLELKS